MASDSDISYAIRPYDERDLANLATFWNASSDQWLASINGGRPYAAGDLQAHVDQQRWLFALVAEMSGGIVGFCSVTPREGDRSACYVAMLGVHPAAQRRGIARELLKRATDSAIAHGYVRIDLHTWEGNRPAISLYKRAGFVWVPGTGILMENYIPTILAQTPIRAILGVDWFDSLAQPIDLAPNDDEIEGRRIYRYRFEKNDHPLVVVVDRSTGGIIRVDTEHYQTSLQVPSLLPTGHGALATFRHLWLQPQSLQPSSVGITGELSIVGARHQVIFPKGNVEFQVPILATEAAPRGALVADVLLPSGDLRLRAGIATPPPVSIEIRQAAPIMAGLPQPFALEVSNHLGAPIELDLSLATGPDVAVAPIRHGARVPAGGSVTLPVQIFAAHAGVYDLDIDVFDRLTSKPLQRPTQLPLPVVDDSSAVGFATGDALVLENVWFRARLELTGARATIQDWRTGVVFVQEARIGPAPWPSELADVQFVGRIESDGTVWRAILTGSSGRFPGITLRREFEVGAGPILHLRHQLRNASAAEAQLTFELGNRSLAPNVPINRLSMVVGGRLVQTDQVYFPDWHESAEAGVPLDERWYAYDGEGQALGLCWSEVSIVVWTTPFAPLLRFGPSTVPPNGVATLPEVLIYAGPGDWRAIRELSSRQMPLAPPEPRGSRGILALGPRDGGVIVAPDGRGKATFEVLSARALPQEIAASVEATSGWRSRIEEIEAPAVAVDASGTLTLSARRTGRKRTGLARVLLRGKLDDARIDIPLVDPGRSGADVSIDWQTLEGQPVAAIDNGLVHARVAPSFGLSMISLARDGIEWLASAFPTPGVLPHSNPWIGGIAPHVCAPNEHLLPGRGGLLLGERARIERVAEREWQGLRCRAIQLSSLLSGLNGFRLDVEYLFLGRSPYVIAIIHLHNHSPAAREVVVGWSASPARLDGGASGTTPRGYGTASATGPVRTRASERQLARSDAPPSPSKAISDPTSSVAAGNGVPLNEAATKVPAPRWLRWSSDPAAIRWTGQNRLDLFPADRWSLAGEGSAGDGPGLALIAGPPLRAYAVDVLPQPQLATWQQLALAPGTTTTVTTLIALVADAAECDVLGQWAGEFGEDR